MKRHKEKAWAVEVAVGGFGETHNQPATRLTVIVAIFTSESGAMENAHFWGEAARVVPVEIRVLPTTHAKKGKKKP